MQMEWRHESQGGSERKDDICDCKRKFNPAASNVVGIVKAKAHLKNYHKY